MTGFVTSRLLTGALFHGKVRGIDDTLYRGPRRQFPPCRLSPGNLFECKGEVNAIKAFGMKSQLPDIVVGMTFNELCGFGGHRFAQKGLIVMPSNRSALRI